MDLNGLVVFARVVEEKGFSSAARRLGLSKSAVSKQISQLEDRVGARLLNRTTRRLSLTDVGAAFYERCARILAEAEEAELAVSHLQTVPRGTLRISGPTSFGGRYLAAALADFLGLYPELRVDLILNDRVVDLVDEGFDVAVRIGRLADSSLIAKRLCPMPRLIVASPAYVAKHGRPDRPEDLVHHNCLLYSYQATGEVWHVQDRQGVSTSVHVTGNFRANNGEVLLEGARAGVGVALLPAFLAGPDVCTGRLVEVLAPDVDTAQAVSAVYPHNRHLSAKVRVFVDFLAERFSGAPWDKACPEQMAPARAQAAS
jgi:DNA-binding transcriptional LysR family regulator